MSEPQAGFLNRTLRGMRRALRRAGGARGPLKDGVQADLPEDDADRLRQVPEPEPESSGIGAVDRSCTSSQAWTSAS